MRLLIRVGVILCALGPLAAHAVPVSYKLSTGNWLHSADACLGGPNDNLFMCAGDGGESFEVDIREGRLSGDMSGAKIKNVTGEFKLAAGSLFEGLTITGGVLGGGNSHLDYVLQSADGSIAGRFYFEFSDGGYDNVLSIDRLVLWGQNADAYVNAKGGTGGQALGVQIDAVSVPEPTTLALLGAALAGMGLARRSDRARAKV